MTSTPSATANLAIATEVAIESAPSSIPLRIWL